MPPVLRIRASRSSSMVEPGAAAGIRINPKCGAALSANPPTTGTTLVTNGCWITSPMNPVPPLGTVMLPAVEDMPRDDACAALMLNPPLNPGPANPKPNEAPAAGLKPLTGGIAPPAAIKEPVRTASAESNANAFIEAVADIVYAGADSRLLCFSRVRDYAEECSQQRGEFDEFPLHTTPKSCSQIAL